MKIIHQDGYTTEELQQYRLIIYKNLIDSAQAIVLALRRFGEDPQEADNRGCAERILEYRLNTEPSFYLSEEIANDVQSLWKDPIMSSLLDRRSEWYLMDSAA